MWHCAKEKLTSCFLPSCCFCNSTSKSNSCVMPRWPLRGVGWQDRGRYGGWTHLVCNKQLLLKIFTFWWSSWESQAVQTSFSSHRFTKYGGSFTSCPTSGALPARVINARQEHFSLGVFYSQTYMEITMIRSWWEILWFALLNSGIYADSSTGKQLICRSLRQQ